MKAFESLKEMLRKDRSVRRFKENERIDRSTLENIVELTRYCASGRNLQPLKYLILNSEKDCDKIFPLLAWAGYLKDWDGPEKGERPSAYIIQCIDRSLTTNCLCDDGLQLQAMTLGATALGLGGCIIKSFNKPKLIAGFEIPEPLDPLYVLALGVPEEKVVIEDLEGDDPETVKYYRTDDNIHHVPKKTLPNLLIN